MKIKTATIGIAFGLMIAVTSVTWGYESEFDHWYVKSYDTSSGGFDNCVMSLHGKREQLLLRLDRQSKLTIGVSRNTWNATAGETSFFRVFVDHVLLTSGDAVAIGPDLFILQLVETDAAISRMREARMILFSGRETFVTFELTGMNRALNMLLECIADGRADRKVTEKPIGAAPLKPTLNRAIGNHIQLQSEDL